jgi:hypothetical protein
VSRYHRRTMFVLLLTSLLAWQDPAPRPAPAKPLEGSAAKTVEPWDDKTAKAAADDLAKLLKGTPSMAQKNEALDRLATGSNKLLLKPLSQLVETDKSVVIKKRAATLIGNQPAADANAAIRRLLKSPGVASQRAVLAELVRALSRCGYEPQQWAEISDLFERDYQPERVPLHEALLDLIATHKERQAVPLLLRNLDEPVPEDVHGANNPPAEYWEARWKAWSVWKGKVKDALFAITGQRFSTAAEAKAWLKQNPLK